MDRINQLERLMSSWQTANIIALKALVKLLVANESLKAGLLEQRLEETIRLAGHEADASPVYQQLQQILRLLADEEPLPMQ
ncbi:hypothetical protein CO731_01507 [Aminobacter sp. MSH1]|uniref:hypothetical protein n=1 Tax=Aminobacter sp. MSH1 TaxID=374606 RepID=UPI000D33AA0F|nr:hypothetical protein [Aminobacter sp. MSH1]AWC22051.1 hypothetical protein CO731_01507 [Aminobacter sp. MSH1]